MYESRAYDKTNDAGFGPDPVVVLVVTGTNDVSRLVNLFAGGQPVIEQIAIGQQMLRQVKRHSGGRAALALSRERVRDGLAQRGGTAARMPDAVGQRIQTRQSGNRV